MIVVGFLRATGGDRDLAVEIARRAAATGARIEMVGVAAADAGGDVALLDLAAAGVGHATVIRTGAAALEPADLDLALRYLPDVRAVILVRPEPTLVPVAALATDWAGAGLVIVGAPPAGGSDGAAADPAIPNAIVLDPPDADPDGTFAGFVAALALRLEAGEHPERALRATLTDLAADPVA